MRGDGNNGNEDERNQEMTLSSSPQSTTAMVSSTGDTAAAVVVASNRTAFSTEDQREKYDVSTLLHHALIAAPVVEIDMVPPPHRKH